ncbi:helix-turn-helix domain-containing protein [Kineococcus radiotolerans]|uniref:Helix-turn-helix domain-containing protein n=1 Tax=Kineococcus radiotolerans (strain ATCC BAA-149 / DSM 14245 / SRS30216) TaxID=266940 RepID=A6WH24_KINRD|nr:helix-turn-helix domain-containing protein [Kineococcus radiotolerans]ABS06113.1 hypothetical protein Krad_4654 [Kineococcus radiotolerans SRS30216 = ATCC BAA-149]
MSIEATLWALNLAPVPIDVSKTKQSPSSSCGFVLVALANHADPEGLNAFPSVETICRYTRLSERTVRSCLDRLEAEGIIRPCDPAIVAAKIKRGDRRPNGYDLMVDRFREDLSDEELVNIARSNTLLRPFIASYRPDLGIYPRGATAAPRETPAPRGAMAAPRAMTPKTRGAMAAPREEALQADGVQVFPSRGAAIAPEPSLNPPTEDSYVTSTSERGGAVDNSSGQRIGDDPAHPPATAALEGSSPAAGDVVFVAIDEDEVERTLLHLPDRLRPTLAEAMRLRQLIVQRMQRGWTREAILAAVERRLRPGGTLNNPCGLFARILVPLDEPPSQQTAPEAVSVAVEEDPWCGECDKTSRRVLDDQGFPDYTLPPCTDCAQLSFAHHMERGAS